jgi:DHA2 family multidrug resistance protein
MVIFVSALQLMLDLGKEHDWFNSMEIRALAAIAVFFFIAFVFWELTEDNPIVDLRVFRHRGFTASVFTLSLGFGAIFGANVLTPLWLQTYMGYTATWAGMTTAWTGVCAVLMAPVAAGLMAKKVDPRRVVFIGLTWIAFVTLLRSNITNDVTYWQISIPLILMGIGLPLFFVPLTTLALGSVDERETASAAGLQNFLRTIAGAMTTSVVTTMWEDKATVARADLAGLADSSGETVRQMTASGFSPEAAIAQLSNLVQGQSVMIATNQLMFLVAIAFMVSAFAVWLAPKPARTVAPGAGGH